MSELIQPDFKRREGATTVAFVVTQLTGFDRLLSLLPAGTRVRIIARRLMRGSWSKYDPDTMRLLIIVPGYGHFLITDRKGHTIGVPEDPDVMKAFGGVGG